MDIQERLEKTVIVHIAFCWILSAGIGLAATTCYLAPKAIVNSLFIIGLILCAEMSRDWGS